MTTLQTPIPMLLVCPVCGRRHIDIGEYATKPHHTHACQICGTQAQRIAQIIGATLPQSAEPAGMAWERPIPHPIHMQQDVLFVLRHVAPPVGDPYRGLPAPLPSLTVELQAVVRPVSDLRSFWNWDKDRQP